MSSYLACGPITRPMERGLEPPDRTCPIRLPGTSGPGKPGQPVRRAGPRRHRVLPYHPRPDVHAVLAEAGVRNVGGNHPRRDDDIPCGPDQTVEAVSDRGGDRGDGNGNKLAAITEGGDKDADRYRWAAIRRRGAMTPTTTHVQRRNIAVAARATGPPGAASWRMAWPADGPAARAPARPPGRWSCLEPGRDCPSGPARGRLPPVVPARTRRSPMNAEGG